MSAAEAPGPGTTPRTSVLVPVVERADDLTALHAALLPVLDRLGGSFEVLYLVSAEFGDAFARATALRASDPERVRVFRFAQPVSEAAALAVGFERARGERLLTVPSYFDAAPEGLLALARALDEGADLAFAGRTGRRDGPWKRAQSVLFNRLSSWATGTRFRDLASGTRALRREVAREIPLYGDFHRFLPVLAHRLGFAVREVDVAQDPRARAPRFYRPRVYLWRLLDILSVFFLSHFTRRPLRLFGAVGAGFALAGGAILAWLAFERVVQDEAIAGRPLLVLGVLLVGLGVQALTIGLLGELLLFFHARELPEYRVAEVIESAPGRATPGGTSGSGA